MEDILWYLGPMCTQFVVVGYEGYLLIPRTHGYMLFKKSVGIMDLITGLIALVINWMLEVLC